MKELWNKLIWTREEDHAEFWHGSPLYQQGVIAFWQFGCMVASFIGAGIGFFSVCWWEDANLMANGCIIGGLAGAGIVTCFTLWHWILP